MLLLRKKVRIISQLRESQICLAFRIEINLRKLGRGFLS